MQTLRWIFPALAAFAALLLLPGAAIAAPGYTDQVKGIEYSATATVGKFSGTVLHNIDPMGIGPPDTGLGKLGGTAADAVPLAIEPTQ